MSEITPVSSQNSGQSASQNISQSANPNRVLMLTAKPHNTAAVDLAAVVISPSPLLWRIQVVSYSALFLAASSALFTVMSSTNYWFIIWLVFSVLILLALRSAWRTQRKEPLRLSVMKGEWLLQSAAGEQQLEPCAEILVWQAVIVLPVRDVLSKRRHRIVALSDAMSAEDWRRLRVWLRMGLSSNL